MSDDDLTKLQAALKSTPSTPDPATREAQIALAMRAYDALSQDTTARRQEGATGARATPEGTREAGLAARARKLFARLTGRAGLAATTGIVAAGLAAVVIGPRMEGPADPDRGFAAPPSEPAGAQTAPATLAESAADSAGPGAQAARPAPAAKVAGASPPGPSAPVADSPAADTAAASAPRAALAPTARRENGGQERLASPAPASSGVFAPPIPEEGDVSSRGAGTEAGGNADPVKVVAQEPVSTFSINVDTASYPLVRAALNAGRMPPPDAVRLEEMVNYFPYAYAAPAPGDGAPFNSTVTLAPTPWNPDTRLMTIALQGAMPPPGDRPPLNLVLLIDSSGAMNQPATLVLLKESLRLVLPELRPEDEIAILAYAGSSGPVLPPTPASDRARILAALDSIGAGGAPAGAAGLARAYGLAEQMAQEGEVSRVLLATDGDFSLGPSSPEDMKRLVESKREGGTYLSVLGFGRGNRDDALMQSLARNGNGQAAYVDTLSEARKVLADQLAGAFFPIASDVGIQVAFNPAEVAEYRLLGYETRPLRRENFTKDRMDAGEIAAGHQVTALYEITPVGSPAVLHDPLRYGGGSGTATAPSGDRGAELALLRLRWKAPGTQRSALLETPIPREGGRASDDTRFAAAIAGFAQLLQGSPYTGDWSYGDAIALAQSAKGEDAFGYRAEAITLMRLAESLSR